VYVTFSPVADAVRFELRDVDPVLDAVLAQCFWTRDGDVWHRSYPRSAPHLDAAMARFADRAEAMFRQLAYLDPVRWAQALEVFAARARDAGLRWWLTGSVAACIRGVPLDPHDVDVMIDHADVPAFADAFADVVVEPLVDTGGWLTRDFGVIFDDARVDLASDPVAALDVSEPIDCGPWARDHLEVMQWRGFEVLVPPLSTQVTANRRRGRHARADLLEAAARAQG